MSNPPIPTPPQTRQKSASTPRRLQREAENNDASNADILTKEQAIHFLTVKEYLLPGKHADLQTLSHILLQFGNAATKMPKALSDGIKAIAVLMADAAAQHMADEITMMVKTQLSKHMEAFTAEVETLQDTVEHITGATKDITNKMDELNDGFQETADQLAQASQDLVEKSTENTGHTVSDNTYQPRTYTSVAHQQVPPAHESVITCGEITAKQILIQKDPNSADNALETLTEKELVAKANTTLDLMGLEAADKPQDTTFVGAKKL
jgi:hypothetical protein